MMPDIQSVAQFMGFRPPTDERAQQFYTSINELLEDMPTTLLITSSGEADVFA